jgi:hypothetical protein
MVLQIIATNTALKAGSGTVIKMGFVLILKNATFNI